MRGSGAILALILLLTPACGWGEHASVPTTTRRPSATRGVPAQIVVPDVEGLALQGARTSLVGMGLGVVPVYLASEDMAPGVVTGMEPAPGVKVDGATSVEVMVSAGPDPPGGIVWVAHVFKHHRGAFVGNYRGPNSVAVVAISADADAARWTEELDAASEGRRFRLVRCDTTASELRAMQRDLTPLVESHRLEGVFGWGVDPRTCSLGIWGSLPATSIEQLRAWYGDAVTIVDGVGPMTVGPEPCATRRAKNECRPG